MNWAILGTTLAISGFLLALFTLYSSAFKEKVRENLSAFLMNLNRQGNDNNWDEIFIKIFDSFYNSKMFSWRRIGFSVLTSLVIASLVITLLHLAMTDFAINGLPIESIVLGIFGGVALNIIPDFFSLQETRWIIKKVMSSSKNIIKLSWLILDLVLTNLIFWFYVTALFAPSANGEIDIGTIVEEYSLLFEFYLIKPDRSGGNLFEMEDDLDYIFNLVFTTSIYTTAFTSIWLYIYLFTSGLIKLWFKVRKGTSLAFGLFDVEKKPFLALGAVSATFTFLVGLILALVL